MAGVRRLYLYWDPALDGDFRRRLERALGGLKVEASDGDTVDPDPDNSAVVMALASSGGGWAGPANADIVVQAGPGEFPATTGALRLQADDISNTTARWHKLVDRLRDRLGMASLALPAEDLAVQLDAASRRADAAERALATAQLNEGNAERERKRLELALATAAARLTELDAENKRLRLLQESGAYALGAIPPDLRDVAADARDHGWRAEAAAASAAEAAAKLPDALAWGKGASYSGDHRNGRADGFGVMTFRQGSEIIAWYRGAFVDGARNGHGVGMSEDGLIWSGEWKADAACGAGILESPDGQRFEGQVSPDTSGALKAGRGWSWENPSGRTRKVVHQPAAIQLPAPGATID